jgi:hypothetical protein
MQSTAKYATLFKNHPFRTELMRDPMLCALMTRSISWGDCATEEPITQNAPITKFTPITQNAPIMQHASHHVTWEVPTVMHVAMAKEIPFTPVGKPFTPVGKPFTNVGKPASLRPVEMPVNSSIKTIIVNNIPRTITKEEMIEIFSEFGVISGAHLPKNTDQNSPYFGTLRGFAMIQFVDARDAQKAHMMCVRDQFYVWDLPVSVQIAKEDRVIYTVKK